MHPTGEDQEAANQAQQARNLNQQEHNVGQKGDNVTQVTRNETAHRLGEALLDQTTGLVASVDALGAKLAADEEAIRANRHLIKWLFAAVGLIAVTLAVVAVTLVSVVILTRDTKHLVERVDGVTDPAAVEASRVAQTAVVNRIITCVNNNTVHVLNRTVPLLPDCPQIP